MWTNKRPNWQADDSAAKRSRTMAPAATGRKRRRVGKFARGVARSYKKGRSLPAQVAALTKVVKKDHKALVGSADYQDWYYPIQTGVTAHDAWQGMSIIAPSYWQATCRQQLDSDSQNDCMLKNCTISFVSTHGPGLTNFVGWTVIVARATNHFVPQTGTFNDFLRVGEDYTRMGTGNDPILCAKKFRILKKWSFDTRPYTSGSPSAGDATDAAKRRRGTFKLNQKLVGIGVGGTANTRTWRARTAADLKLTERLFVFWYCNTFDGTPFTATTAPSMSVTARFTTETR